jgi:hypothetical protein
MDIGLILNTSDWHAVAVTLKEELQQSGASDPVGERTRKVKSCYHHSIKVSSEGP